MPCRFRGPSAAERSNSGVLVDDKDEEEEDDKEELTDEEVEFVVGAARFTLLTVDTEGGGGGGTIIDGLGLVAVVLIEDTGGETVGDKDVISGEILVSSGD